MGTRLVHRAGARLALAFALLSACGRGDAPEGATESEPELDGFDTSRRGLIDCSTREDTGYTQGSAFTISVVTADGRPVEVDTANAYAVMQAAAAADGVSLSVVSGFRTMAEQEYLYGCYVNCNCNSCNLAARPGYSNHQSGHALDLNTSSPGVLNWLNAHAAAFGFSRTVPSEAWHWEWWGGGPGGGPCGRCQPGCEGSERVGADCGRGDCGAFGARCVDDALGVRCASIYCPDVGEADVCVDETTVGRCTDGALETGDCGAFAAYCSPVAGPARCVSAFCVASANEVPVAHDTCLPDGGRYHCTSLGGIEPAPCPEGQICRPGRAGATCVRPGAGEVPAPRFGGGASGLPGPARAADGAVPALPPLSRAPGFEAGGVAGGGCSATALGRRGAPAELVALLGLGLAAGRVRRRRSARGLDRTR